ncbi:GNAT family N-acetyltransferase [Streptomyces sp. NPDC056549]|uniref:GNAT family N-acetyltransferase n=1 Tax=Streptomyces sp. NPDC056549 TaxID=3345864 RepID=UPI00368074DF
MAVLAVGAQCSTKPRTSCPPTGPCCCATTPSSSRSCPATCTRRPGHRFNIRFTVYDLTGDHPVPGGVTTLPNDSIRTAEFVIMLSREARGQGLGTEATRLTLDYAFHICLRGAWVI